MDATRSGPSPWVTLGISLGITVAGVGAAWGRQGAEHTALERRVTTNETSIASIQAKQAAQGEQLARIGPTLDAIRERLDDIREAVSRR